MGVSAEGNIAYGSGPWTGLFDTGNITPLGASLSPFNTPDDLALSGNGAWYGGGFGFSAGPPGAGVTQAYYETWREFLKNLLGHCP